jgi:hypothetical protein
VLTAIADQRQAAGMLPKCGDRGSELSETAQKPP